MSVTDEATSGASGRVEPELAAVREAAQACVEAQAAGEPDESARARVTLAAKAALDAGHALNAVAAAEREGQQAARERLGPGLLRAVERAAKKLRDARVEHEDVIVQAARVGLSVREIAERAGVAHATVSALVRRHGSPSSDGNARERDVAAREIDGANGDG